MLYLMVLMQYPSNTDIFSTIINTFKHSESFIYVTYECNNCTYVMKVPLLSKNVLINTNNCFKLSVMTCCAFFFVTSLM